MVSYLLTLANILLQDYHYYLSSTELINKNNSVNKTSNSIYPSYDGDILQMSNLIFFKSDFSILRHVFLKGVNELEQRQDTIITTCNAETIGMYLFKILCRLFNHHIFVVSRLIGHTVNGTYVLFKVNSKYADISTPTIFILTT